MAFLAPLAPYALGGLGALKAVGASAIALVTATGLGTTIFATAGAYATKEVTDMTTALVTESVHNVALPIVSSTARVIGEVLTLTGITAGLYAACAKAKEESFLYCKESIYAPGCISSMLVEHTSCPGAAFITIVDVKYGYDKYQSYGMKI